jgi:hypothetical protein
MESPFFVARLILTFIFLMFSSTGFAQSNYELLTISSGVVNALNTAEEVATLEGSISICRFRKCTRAVVTGRLSLQDGVHLKQSGHKQSVWISRNR